MTDERYHIIFRGEITPGADPDLVKEKTARIFGIDVVKAEKLFSGKTFVVKKNVSKETCRKMVMLFKKAGAVCEIKKSKPAETETKRIQQKPPEADKIEERRDKKQENRGKTEKSQEALKAQDRVLPQSSHPKIDPHAASRLWSFSDKDDDPFSEPLSVPASNGFKWITQGFSLFKKNPGPWILTTVVFFIINGVAQLIPFLGSLAMNILNPVFGAGFIIGCDDQDRGDNFSVSHLFEGFTTNFKDLLLFSVIFFIAFSVIMGVIATAGFLFVAGAAGGLALLKNPTLLLNTSPVIVVVFVLFALMVTLPMAMVYWFSPALIALNDVPFFEAMKLSFRACLMNLLPFLIYGLVFILLFGVIFGLITTATFLTASFSMVAGILGFVATAVVVLAITPVAIASTYASYKDIFFGE